MIRPLYTKQEFLNLPASERIGTVIADGMWYSFTKWKNIAKVSEEELSSWVDEHVRTGELLPAPTGALSYRFPIDSVRSWHSRRGVPVGTQLVDFIFPPRVWDGMTEVEGFLFAPRREVGILTFFTSPADYRVIKDGLRGIARVREDRPGVYKAYGLSATYIRSAIMKICEDTGARVDKMSARNSNPRRELVDFSPAFLSGIIHFYRNFGKTLLRKEKETVQIFLPDPEDQDSQMVIWVIYALEKFDEKACVPFSGYFDTVMRHWPYDLPYYFLGKDLSTFQRERSRALASLRKKHGVSEDHVFSVTELAEEMGVSHTDFVTLEEKHQAWMRERNATSLTWGDTNDEKGVTSGVFAGSHVFEDVELANKVSYSAVVSALETGDYESGFNLITQVDSSNIDMKVVGSLSPVFVSEFKKRLDSYGGSDT